MSHSAPFMVIGENIHCTRIFKVGGPSVKMLDDGSYVITYSEDGQEQHLPIPSRFVTTAEWVKGKKVKHTVVAIWQGLYGDDAGQRAGIAYLEHLAKRQIANGAAFLDVNVDEFETELADRLRAMQWAVTVIQRVSTVPLSIDSSDVQILQAGITACDPALGRPIINSVSLERPEAIDIARAAGAAVIAGATGEHSMPSTVEERLANFARLMPLLNAAGFELNDIYLDPLVFPVSVDATKGKTFLETVQALRRLYGPEIHFAAGLSNVSFGLPNRKLLNQTFAYLSVEAGCNGGIVDPAQINAERLATLDTATDGFRFAKALLVGEDEFGMNYIRAAKKGLI